MQFDKYVWYGMKFVVWTMGNGNVIHLKYGMLSQSDLNLKDLRITLTSRPILAFFRSLAT